MRNRVLAGLVGCVLLAAAAAVAGVTKANFPSVTFPDGTTGVITAGSKINNKDLFTVCDYFSDGYRTYLGMYQNPDFATTDPAALLDFCLAHYVDRQ
jgi:hypothetical protein